MTGLPDICAEGDFCIKADGTWFHEGAPIGRPALVRLFANVLTRDDSGAFWLVTLAERVLVRVEDAPFLAVELVRDGKGEQQILRFRTNIDDWVTLDQAHPLIVRGTATSPRPYLGLDGGMEALILRAVYYELAALAVAKPKSEPGSAALGVWSSGRYFSLSPVDTGSPTA